MSDEPILFTEELALSLWYKALASEIGVTFQISESPENIKMKMYKARRDINDPRINELTFHLNDDHKTVMIYHKGSEEPLA